MEGGGTDIGTRAGVRRVGPPGVKGNFDGGATDCVAGSLVWTDPMEDVVFCGMGGGMGKGTCPLGTNGGPTGTWLACCELGTVLA